MHRIRGTEGNAIDISMLHCDYKGKRERNARSISLRLYLFQAERGRVGLLTLSSPFSPSPRNLLLISFAKHTSFFRTQTPYSTPTFTMTDFLNISPLPSYVDGKAFEGKGSYTVLDPHDTTKEIHKVSSITVDDVPAVIAAAKKALPAWKAVSGFQLVFSPYRSSFRSVTLLCNSPCSEKPSHELQLM